jgi:hypothetical protein
MTESVQSRIELRVTGAEQADKAAVSLDRLAVAHDGVTVAQDRESKVRERLEQKLERQARAMDHEYRLLRRAAEAQKILDQARTDGLSNLTAFNRLQGALSKTQQDNTKLTALQRHEWVNLSRQFQDVATMAAMGAPPMQILTSQAAQFFDIFSSARGGPKAALLEFGATAVRVLTGPIGAATALAAAVAGVSFEAGKAQRQLAELAAQSRSSGLSAETLQGAKVIGAGVGLDDKAAVGAFSTAGRRFESYSRNSGSVLSTLQQVDKSFLGVLDKARSAGEFVDLLNTKIAQLPTRQAEQLAAALYGDEAAKRLLDSIRAGEVSMRALREASGATGQSLGQSATAAEQMQNRIAAAAAEADTKLLNAFRNVASPVDSIKLGWYGVVGAIADAVEKSERLQRTMSAMTSWSALFAEIGRGYDAVDKMLGARPVSRLEDDRPRLARPGDIPFPNFTEARAAFLPKLATPPVGASRHLFEKPERGHGGKSAVEKEADAYAKITAELEGQIRLASSLGAEHERVSLALKIQQEQAKLGAAASAEHKQHVGDLVTRLDMAERAQKKLTEEGQRYANAIKQVGDVFARSLDSFADDLMKGTSAGKALSGILQQLERDAIRLASRSISESLFGTGKSENTGVLGSLFKGTAGALGIGGGSGSGGFLGSLGSFLGLGGGGGTMAPFANGGVMTSAGPVPLRRYERGGIANSMQMAIFAEGSRPEAYVPLPDGRSIPVTMDSAPAVQPAPASNVEVHNYAAGVQVTPKMTPHGVALIVREVATEIAAATVEANNRSLPSILSELNRNRN